MVQEINTSLLTNLRFVPSQKRIALNNAASQEPENLCSKKLFDPILAEKLYTPEVGFQVVLGGTIYEVSSKEFLLI